MTRKPIYVVRPSYPGLEEYTSTLSEVWKRNWFANFGATHEKLEAALENYLNVDALSLCANGTLALVLAIKALELSPGAEVITTPFTFIGTTNAISWNGLKPVFVDVEEQGFNICPSAIEAAISPNTEAVVAVHCYGVPCNVEKIQKIAQKHGLKVIYDAAHCFGVKTLSGKSVMEFGDLSAISFHATKVFSTVEGGGVVSSKNLKPKLKSLSNFGFDLSGGAPLLGINAKMSELHAAFGLSILPRVDNFIRERKRVYRKYHERLSGIQSLILPDFSGHTSNYSYYPIIINSDRIEASDLVDLMAKNNIFARRYFYPLVNLFEMYAKCTVSGKLDNASFVSNNVICLPISPNLTDDEIDHVCDVLKRKMI